MAIYISTYKIVNKNGGLCPTGAIITYAISYLQPFITHLSSSLFHQSIGRSMSCLRYYLLAITPIKKRRSFYL